MTGPHVNEGVHQLFFGWSYDANEHMVVAGTYNETHQRQWRSRLQDYTRLQPIGGSEPPETALSCLEFEDAVAIVRRVRGGHSSGRNNAHVLIGAKDVLDSSLALRLERWAGWEDSVPQSGPAILDPLLLREQAAPAERSPGQVSVMERQLAAAITRLLEYPEAPLSIIGCPDDYRLPMLWALRAAAGDHLVQAFGARRRWTFSTYEERHAAALVNLPEIVFLPTVPGSAEPHNRMIVRFGEQPGDNSPYAGLAQQLVNSLLRGAPAPPRPVVTPRSTDDPQPQRPHPESRREPEPERAQHQEREPAVRHKQPMRPASNARKELVLPLLRARSTDEFLKVLKWLSTQDREQLRAVFGVATVNRVAELVEHYSRNEVLNKILDVLYGQEFEDLQGRDDVKKHAARLSKNCRSDQLVIILGYRAREHARSEVTELVLERSLQPGAPLGPQRKFRALDGLSWMRRRRLQIAGAVVAAFMLVALGLTGGYLIWRPASAEAVAPTVPATAAPRQDPQVMKPRSGTVQIRVDARLDQVWAFVLADGLYYPQAACTQLGAGTEIWSCAQVYDPPVGSGTAPVLIAVVVRDKQTPELATLAAQQKGVSPGQDWGSQVAVGP